MKNTIPTRIADFLKNLPPFDLFEAQALYQLATEILVRYYEKDENVFEQGAMPESFFFIVKEGAIALELIENDQSTLIDICDEGDLFGLRPLVAEDEYRLSAIAREDSLLYLIPTTAFDKHTKANPQIAYYLASTFASDKRLNFKDKRSDRQFLRVNITKEKASLVEVQTLNDLKKPVTCPPGFTIRKAAERMASENVGSIIIVNEVNHPEGIITDTDLRNKVATGKIGLDQLVKDVMSSPVRTIPPSQQVADIQITMIKHRVHHLCITEDGTPKSPVLGVISEHDLLVTQGNSPAILIREIIRSKTVEHLKMLRERAEGLLEDYLHQEVAISFIADIMSEVNDVIIRKCILFAEANMEKEGYKRPEEGYCWLGLGSEGRQEQLLRTDQDNALIFHNPPEEHLEDIRKYYLTFSKKVNDYLNTVGFEYCPAEMMASNPKWCLSLNEWKSQFSKWIYSPGKKEVMHTTIFFDYRPLYGDETLAEALTESIFKNLEKQEIFLSFLAKDATRNPSPLSFFRNFIVERNGEHKDEFDIKARAMMPLVDAARVLILHHQIPRINNTFKRYEKLARVNPEHAELFEQAADAYEILMRLRAMQGLKNNDSGRFFRPEELNKMQRLMLRNSFTPINDLHKILTQRFSLNLFAG